MSQQHSTVLGGHQNGQGLIIVWLSKHVTLRGIIIMSIGDGLHGDPNKSTYWQLAVGYQFKKSWFNDIESAHILFMIKNLSCHQYRNSCCEDKAINDHLISTMGFPILIRQSRKITKEKFQINFRRISLTIETGPSPSASSAFHMGSPVLRTK